MKKRIISAVLSAALVAGLACSCARQEGGVFPVAAPHSAVEMVLLADEAVALADAPPAVSTGLVAKRGTQVKGNDRGEIDYSNTKDGYVIVQVKADSGKRWKVQVKGPTTTYTYNLTPKTQTVLSLSDGNGTYKITLYENVSGTKYAAVVSQQVSVTLKDEFTPFLYSNQYVDHAAAPKAVAKGAELTKDCKNELEKVAKVYDYVVNGLTYDRELAATVKSGYLPVLDQVLEKKKGICFDYAALMTGMLRSQGVPCKLVVGYAGTAYHAWISVWTDQEGWIDSVVFFDGSTWQRMDPTFASNGKKDAAIMKYIGDGSNYTAKYFY